MRATTAATRRFMVLMRDASLADLIWVANFNRLQSHIYVYSFEETSVRILDERDNIPWPIVFLLARYHRKFIVQNERGPHPSVVGRALNQFKNRIGSGITVILQLARGLL